VSTNQRRSNAPNKKENNCRITSEFGKSSERSLQSKESLQNLIMSTSNKKENNFHGWEKFQEIALGMATKIWVIN
jgi:hypothetical protein